MKLLKWSSEKKLRLPLWGGLLVSALLAGVFLFLRERNAFAALSPEEASLVQTCARNLSSLPQSASSARLLPALSAKTALQLYFFFLILGTAACFQNQKPDARNDSITLPKAQSVGFTYSFLCMDINWGSEKVQKLLRQEAWTQPPALDEEQQKRERYIYQNYTELPNTVPERVYALAEEITEGLSTDYDRMKAIEGWLNRLTYTTSPPQCPEGQDFTDYFLFDSQTGYCT